MGQIVGVLFVTAGVIWATLDNASAHNNVRRRSSISIFFWDLTVLSQNNPGSTTEFVTGILLLLVAMILSAGMGLFQEVTYKKYGKQWREGLFYTVCVIDSVYTFDEILTNILFQHFLALPFFLFFYRDLLAQVAAYQKSPLMSLPDIFEQVPLMGSLNRMLPEAILSKLKVFYVHKLWAFLLMNVLTQYCCIAGVNRMTSVATSLTLNLVLNLRKFASLLFSIIYFDNDFGFGAIMGTLLVFFGTLIYTQAGLQTNKKTQTATSRVAPAASRKTN